MSSTRRIALLVDPLTAVVAGARHVRELSQELSRRGHDVRAFGAPAALLEESTSTIASERDGAARIRVGASVLLYRPDALIAYDSLSPAAWLGARLARRLRAPLVLVEPGAWVEGKLVQRALWRVGEALWGPLVRRTASGVLALDARARTLALERGFAPGRVVLWPHGVDFERFRPGLASAELARHRVRGRVLTCVGARDAEPEFEVTLDAFARTVGQRDDWSLVLATREPTPRLKLLAQRLGVASRTHFFPLDERELPSLFASSTLVAFPRASQANLALDVARALAAGATVLAGDDPLTRALIEPEVTGLLAPGRDLDAWTNLLRRAASSPEVRRRISRAARTSAEQRWSWPSAATELERTLANARAPAQTAATRPLATEATR